MPLHEPQFSSAQASSPSDDWSDDFDKFEVADLRSGLIVRGWGDSEFGLKMREGPAKRAVDGLWMWSRTGSAGQDFARRPFASATPNLPMSKGSASLEHVKSAAALTKRGKHSFSVRSCAIICLMVGKGRILTVLW